MRAPDWDAAAFAADYATALAALAGALRPAAAWSRSRSTSAARAPARAVEEANAIIEAAARAHDARVLDLRGFGARNLVMTDHVHPTAFGQVWIAERALEVLGDGACACGPRR